MTGVPLFDLVIQNVRLVRPRHTAIEEVDVAIAGGRFAQIAPRIDPSRAAARFDAHGLLGFPGVVDSHMHVGLYNSVPEDALSESRAAAMGGVTTSLSYVRTGQNYLNRGGPYLEFMPDLLALSDGRYYVDYGFHLAPISRAHIGEMEPLLHEFGVSSFKIFMFYGGHGPKGRSENQHHFLMIDPEERYDFAHFEFIMRELAAIADRNPAIRDALSLSLHCEIADILAAYTERVEAEGILTGLRAYSASHPPHSEGLAIWIAAYLAHETGCRNVNLLHLSSRKAIEAALAMRELLPHIDFKLEVLLGHLLLDVDAPAGNLAKVNPPVRPREDVEFLWRALLDGHVDWVTSDHACCSRAEKLDPEAPDDIFKARTGFANTEYLLAGLFTEGGRRGMPYHRMAELLSWNGARRFGLWAKGDVAPGYDADLVLFDPNDPFVVGADSSLSSQDFSPFEGFRMQGRVKSTFLRGMLIYNEGEIIGPPAGRYLRRPYGARPD